MSSTDTGFYVARVRMNAVSRFLEWAGRARATMRPYEVVWWFLAACVVIGNIGVLFGDFTGPVYYMIAFGGSAGCAWSWLFARSLFRPEATLIRWPLFLLGATVLFEGAWEVTQGLSTTGETHRLIANAASFLCISLLALVFVETLSGFTKELPKAERRFRQLFVGFFAFALVVGLLWVGGASEGSIAAQSQTPSRLAFGLLTIVGGRFAIEFRKKNPLVGPARAQRKNRRQVNDQALVGLANRIRAALENEQYFATPQLKVSDLAQALGEPEYKISQCITGVMGYPNFNRLVNTYRIANAKSALENTECDERQILSIALDCGFNSIGPFNRAFKEQVGMTPRRYRAGQA